jgi:hypothetical protein
MNPADAGAGMLTRVVGVMNPAGATRVVGS